MRLLLMENVMASILKRGQYSVQAVIRRRGFPTQRWPRMIEHDMDRGTWRDSTSAQRSTLGDVLRRYLAEVTPARKVP